MSKMGISTYMSYRGAQIFEAVGLSQPLLDRYFKGVRSTIGGLSLFDVMQEAVDTHRSAFHRDPSLRIALDDGGEYAWRPRGEEHMWTPQAVASLQRAVRFDDFGQYREYAQIINDQSKRHMTLRGLLDFKADPARAVPVSEVEPASEIVKRFATGAMSLGSISAEAHAALAVAMNRLGGKSNTGEGGEDEKRYETEMRTGASGIKDGMTLADVLGYCGTKHFVRAMLDSFRMEAVTEGSNIHATTIYPGAVRTELLNTVAPSETKTMVEKFYEQAGMTPDVIANAVLYALSQPDNVNVSDLVVRPSMEG